MAGFSFGVLMSRPLYVIAREIRADWKKPSVYALPYIEAMQMLNGIDETYGFDDAHEIVIRFLCNASGWRGDNARRIKAELKALSS
jgi:hypothetical protein